MERLLPSPLIERALGPRPSPSDGASVDLWNEGIDLIYSHRYREGISAKTGDALGQEPLLGTRQYDEHVAAHERLSEIQAGLGLEPQSPVPRAEVADMTIDL